MKTLAVFAIEEVLPFTGGNAPKKIYKTDEGDLIHVKMHSLRYQTFKKSLECVCCGMKGCCFVLERQFSEQNHQAHFNLYGLDNDQPVLFTKDHIHPRSKGGKNHIDNMQTMCFVCNSLKKHYTLTVEQLQSVLQFKKDLLDGSEELTDKKVAQLVEQEIQQF